MEGVAVIEAMAVSVVEDELSFAQVGWLMKKLMNGKMIIRIFKRSWFRGRIFLTAFQSLNCLCFVSKHFFGMLATDNHEVKEFESEWIFFVNTYWAFRRWLFFRSPLSRWPRISIITTPWKARTIALFVALYKQALMPLPHPFHRRWFRIFLLWRYLYLGFYLFPFVQFYPEEDHRHEFSCNCGPVRLYSTQARYESSWWTQDL